MTEAGLETDVIVVGGGLAGTLLAEALLALPLRVALIEARDVTALEQPSFDGRATALANGSVRVLDTLGVWPSIRPEAEAIRHIHIGQAGRFGAARIHADEEGVEALGYTIENRVLGAALWAGLDRDGFRCFSPATVTGIDAAGAGVAARLETEKGTQCLHGRLLVAADGARSTVRDALGIDVRADEYGQRAVIANCAMERPQPGWAYERFTGEGPLAVLPLTGGRVAVVWTLADAAARSLEEARDEAFAAALERRFGLRLGRVRRAGRRASHPLFRSRSIAVTAERSALIGNAAVSMHPVAGQSFNLAVRDIATLAELIATALDDGTDIGAPAVLARYRQWRQSDQRKVAWFTHNLVTGMNLSLPGAAGLRDLGLIAFDLLPGAKRVLARHTMGLAGRVPRLARGLPLS